MHGQRPKQRTKVMQDMQRIAAIKIVLAPSCHAKRRSPEQRKGALQT